MEKSWYLIDKDNFVFIQDGESKEKALERYLKDLDIINLKADENLPHGIKKRIARIASKYNLDLDIINNFKLRERGLGHASYNWEYNIFKIVPEYFIRQGMIRLGMRKMIPEFEKTFLHEFGHAVWHQTLTDKQKADYINLIPKFHEEVKDKTLYVRGKTNRLDGKEVFSQYWTGALKPFVSDYARYNPKEDFAESFVWHRVAPDELKAIDANRFEFMEKISHKAEDIEKVVHERAHLTMRIGGVRKPTQVRFRRGTSRTGVPYHVQRIIRPEKVTTILVTPKKRQIKWHTPGTKPTKPRRSRIIPTRRKPYTARGFRRHLENIVRNFSSGRGVREIRGDIKRAK